MSQIQKLEQDVINQIAAGEVVERPASIVKELVENSLDAGATSVIVKITTGGIDKIEIHDNGFGIQEDDLPRALERFATSKLTETKDLETLYTYGFRGEALAAISAVSITTISSRFKESDAGYVVTSTFSKLGEITPKGKSVGTTISIEKLFSNVPARLKFIKTQETEFRYILEVFQNFALTRPDVSFTLEHNGKEIYSLSAAEDSLIKRIGIFFKLNKEDLVEVQHQEFGITISGAVLHPRLLTQQARYQRFFVNGRMIDDRGLARGVQKGFEPYIPFGVKPSFVLFVAINPSQVDANVHPRKIEVKFLNPFRVFQAIEHAVSGALSSKINTEMNIGSQKISFTPNSSIGTAQSSRFSAKIPLYGGFNLQNLKQNNQSRLKVISSTESINTEVEMQTPILPYDRKIVSTRAILSRYIVVEWERELWIVDQHAAAERIRFELLKKRLQFGSQFESQKLLTPIIIHLSAQELGILKENTDLFTKLGIEINITTDTCELLSIPQFLLKADLQALMHDTITELATLAKEDNTPEISDFAAYHNMSLVVATMACHSSIRMNERISDTNADSLIKDLLACEVPYACPHGRSIIWKLSNEEIDRHFMR